jgi:hypothetical protein
MIRTSQELSDTLEEINTSLDYTIGSFSETVSKEKADELFENIEDRLTTLYTKIRKLEDLHNFVESYIQDTFKKKSAAYKEAERKIDTLLNSYEESKKSVSVASFNTNTSKIIRDRDGTILKNADNSFSCVTSAFTVANTAAVNSVDVKSDNIYYKNSPLPINRYRSYYIVEDISRNGINETLTVLFDKNTPVNFINIDTSKCDVDSVMLINSNNELIEVDNMFNAEYIKGIKIALNSRDYAKKIVDCLPYSSTDGLDYEKYISNIKNGIYESELNYL